ncbi:TIGR02444 family protein [Teredinibacter turnerae]|uniref:TIGR02444 family protein n=1 Tax=Teredinibacter turnerae TaxID=2426 RepID=UPI00040749FB|nr:TIGR02444 family protein [Teredinibacter turnerae]
MTEPATSAAWRTTLWDYATKVYAYKEVERALLNLQDNYYANVNILLWLCWLEEEAIVLERSLLDDVLITVDTVNQATLIKLRESRRFIKSAGSFTDVQVKLITKQLLNAELMIEKILIHRLQDITRKNLDGDGGAEPLTVTYYLDFLGIPDARAIARSVRSVCRSAQSQGVHSQIYQRSHPAPPKTSS